MYSQTLQAQSGELLAGGFSEQIPKTATVPSGKLRKTGFNQRLLEALHSSHFLPGCEFQMMTFILASGI